MWCDFLKGGFRKDLREPKCLFNLKKSIKIKFMDYLVNCKTIKVQQRSFFLQKG